MSVFFLNIPKELELYLDGCVWDVGTESGGGGGQSVSILSITGLPPGLNLLAYRVLGTAVVQRDTYWMLVEDGDAVGFEYDDASGMMIAMHRDRPYEVARDAISSSPTYTLTPEQRQAWFSSSSYMSHCLRIAGPASTVLFEYPSTHKTDAVSYTSSDNPQFIFKFPRMDEYVMPPPSLSHEQVNAYCLDYSDALERLLGDCGGAIDGWQYLCGLLQLSFLNFIDLEHYESLVIWKKMLLLLLRSERMLHTYPQRYHDVVPVLYHQLHRLSSSDPTVVMPIKDLVLEFMTNAGQEPVLHSIISKFYNKLLSWYGWTGGDDDDDDVVVVDLDEQLY